MINRKASIQKLAGFSRIDREKKTVSLMVNIYCRAKHKPNDVPCPAFLCRKTVNEVSVPTGKAAL